MNQDRQVLRELTVKWAQRVQPVQMAKWVRPAQQVQQVLAEAEDCFITADVIIKRNRPCI